MASLNGIILWRLFMASLCGINYGVSLWHHIMASLSKIVETTYYDVSTIYSYQNNEYVSVRTKLPVQPL